MPSLEFLYFCFYYWLNLCSCIVFVDIWLILLLFIVILVEDTLSCLVFFLSWKVLVVISSLILSLYFYTMLSYLTNIFDSVRIMNLVSLVNTPCFCKYPWTIYNSVIQYLLFLVVSVSTHYKNLWHILNREVAISDSYFYCFLNERCVSLPVIY